MRKPRHEIYVPSVGPRDAKLVIVGEGPGVQEATHSWPVNPAEPYGDQWWEPTPFVGPAGSRMNRMLRSAGIDREKVYITNATKYLPTGDKDKYFMQKGSPTEAYMEGIKELYAELKDVKPNVIVAMGNYALWALTGEMKITLWRGSIMKAHNGMKVVPTLHPAFIMRGMAHKEPLAIWDLQRAVEESHSPDIILPERNIIANPSDEEYNWAIEELLRGDHITYDTEWYSSDSVSCIGYTNSPDWAIVLPVWHRKYKESIQLLLEQSDLLKVAQNGMFDVTNLHRAGFEVRGPHADTMIAWHSCWGDLREKSLHVITSVCTREPYYKEDLKIWGQTGNDETLWQYNGKDNCVTDESWHYIDESEFDYCGARPGYEISMSIFETMARATNVGIRADKQVLVEMREKMLKQADALEAIISDFVGYSFNCRSPKQVAELVYDQLGVRSSTRSTAQEYLMDIAASTKDATVKGIVTSVTKVRHIKTLTSNHINEKIIDPADGRIRCSWNLAGTRNGRLSSSVTYWGTGVPLQVIPEKEPWNARKIFISDDDHYFIGFDLDQAEARVVAYLTHDEELIEDMDSDIDIHRKLAAQLPFGFTYEQLCEMPKDSRQRQLAKKCRHGFNYQMGPKIFQLSVNHDYLDTGIGIDFKTARELRDAYLALHPNLLLWWKGVEDKLSKNGSMVNALGRRRRFFGEWGGELFRDGTAFEPQSTVADTTTLGIADIDKKLEWATPLLHMHDGSIIQVPDRIPVEEAAGAIKELVTRKLRIAGQEMTIPVSVYSGHSWGDMKKVG